MPDAPDRQKRQKRPEAVRRLLLEKAAELAAGGGMAALTVQGVASAAGVTKGGFFHHFPSRQALLGAMFAELLERFDEAIDRHMAQAPGRGAFTRAYIDTVFDDLDIGSASLWVALWTSAFEDEHLRAAWTDWLEKRTTRHAETDDMERLRIVRFAVDGAWAAIIMGDTTVGSPHQLRKQILALVEEAVGQPLAPSPASKPLPKE